MFGFPPASSLPCPDCGAAISIEEGEHLCDEERHRWHQLFVVNVEVEALDDELRCYLDSPQGRFEVYYAERERLNAAA